MPIWLQMLQALGTLAIASFVACLTWLQWRTNHNALKEKLFDKRMSLFEDVLAYLHEVVASASISDHSIGKLAKLQQRAGFLFGPEIQAYLAEIRRRSAQLRLCQTEYQRISLDQSDRDEWIEREHQELNWLIDQYNFVFDRFRPFMSFASIR